MNIIARYLPNLSRWWFFLIALSITALVTTTVITSKAMPSQTTELRGVWLTNIDSDVLFNRHRLTKALQRLQKLNFNTVYPTVWNGGYTLYPSQVAKQVIGRALDPTPELQGRDILQETIVAGHQKGMSVIPWFEFGLMAPADSELAKRHPQWLTNRRDGTQIWLEGLDRRVWLNPLHPEVQQFIQDLIVEMVNNYDVDGIQFDDHFGFPSEFGYDTLTVKLYQTEHAGQSPPVNPQDPNWVRWRADKVTELMRQLFKVVKERKSKCLISVAPNPLDFSYNYSLADWQSWEQQGLVEELILQVYRNDNSRFIAELEQPEVQAAQSHIPVSVGILTGLKAQFIGLEQIQTQVEAARSRGLAGVSFFYYETLWNIAKEKPHQRQLALQKLFPVAIERPNIFAGWKPPGR